VHDRAVTIAAVLDADSRQWDFRRTGHVFPLRARDRGVLERPGHTEASVDLCRSAGLPPVAVICEILREDGAVARIPDLESFASVHGIAIASIEELIEYRTRTEGTGSHAALA
jgi:3,4-dihydroxy-2-butanone 4-phosphate synthase